MINTVIKYMDDKNQNKKVYFPSFSEVSNFYYFTNENIKGYFEELNFSNIHTALTVCASGDQILNLVNKGIKKIDTFDSNVMAQYFALGIKKAALLTFDRNNYINFFKLMINDEITAYEQKKLIDTISINMEEPYKTFWNQIFENNLNKNYDIPVFKVLGINYHNLDLVHNINSYLSTDEEYNITKENMKDAKINFIKSDILKLKENFKEKYDIILFSNILDYLYRQFGYFWSYEKIRPYVDEQFKDLLNSDGIIILAYIFKYKSKRSTFSKTNLVNNSTVKLDDMNNANIISFPSIDDRIKDGVIVKK